MKMIREGHNSILPAPRHLLGNELVRLSLAVCLFTVCSISLNALGAVNLTIVSSLSDATGTFPECRLIQAEDGSFYGATYAGGTNGYQGHESGFGAVFRISTNGTITTLAHFTGTNGLLHAEAGLVQARDGNLYGTTTGDFGPTGKYGTVFRLTTNGILTTLVTFNGLNGRAPYGALTEANDGNLYGTTSSSGPNGYGTVFRITTNGTFATVVSFGITNGGSPKSRVLQGSDGFLYGTTAGGGTFGYGTLFKLGTNGFLTTLVSFDNTNGAGPYAGLVQGKDGCFYGTTRDGGTWGKGTVFKVTPVGILTQLAAFNGTNGSSPYAELVEGLDGNFYGTTTFGSISNYGNVFMITPTGTLTELVAFVRTNGAQPYAGLLQGRDGDFYDTTGHGGVNGSGTVFRFPMPFALQSTGIPSGFFNFTWDAVVGRAYQIQSKTDLSSQNWLNHSPTFTATNATMASGTLATTNATEFYRVVLLP